MNIKIEHNVPVPSPRGIKWNDIKSTLQSMKIGDSFICEQKVANEFRGVAPRYQMKVTGRVQPDGQVRVWRIK